MTYGDDLDRALFALPLEEPPADLRSSILRATVYAAPIEAPVVMSLWETVGLGIVLALACWLSLALLTNQALTAGLVRASSDLAQSLTDPLVLGWIAAGAAVALALMFVNAGSLLRPLRFGRS